MSFGILKSESVTDQDWKAKVLSLKNSSDHGIKADQETTDRCLEYQIELEESMAYMHQCSLFGDSRSILLSKS